MLRRSVDGPPLGAGRASFQGSLTSVTGGDERMHGGMKFYSGSAAAARAYVEADHSRADDYYLAEGSGVAERYVATLRTVGSAPDCKVAARARWTATTYERWVPGYDVETGGAKGRISKPTNALRFVEVVVNGPKTWSLAASLHPEIAAAYDAAQERAAVEIIGWLAEHSTTRVGPRDRQVQVPVERGSRRRSSATTPRAPATPTATSTSRSTRRCSPWASGARSTRSAPATASRRSTASATPPSCATRSSARLSPRHGYTLDEAGEVEQLAPYAGRFSQRASQITRNVDRYEAEWRADHPGEEPGPKLRRTWDRRAWADARPDKVVPASGAELVARWNDELLDLGFRPPTRSRQLDPTAIGRLRRDVAVDLILTRLGSKRSAWNAADIRGEAEKLIAVRRDRRRSSRDASSSPRTSPPVRSRECRTLRERDDVPDHIREPHLRPRPRRRGGADRQPRHRARWDRSSTPPASTGPTHLDLAQRKVVAALAGEAGLLVIEGAAGTGKTTTLAAARDVLDAQRPTTRRRHPHPQGRAGRPATGRHRRVLGGVAHPPARVPVGRGRTLVAASTPRPDARARLLPGDVLLVDEAGMLDQDTARALFAIADRAHATRRAARRPSPAARRRPRRGTRPRRTMGAARGAPRARVGAPLRRPGVRRPQPAHARR